MNEIVFVIALLSFRIQFYGYSQMKKILFLSKSMKGSPFLFAIQCRGKSELYYRVQNCKGVYDMKQRLSFPFLSSEIS